MNSRILLYSSPAMLPLAKSIASSSDGKILLGDISWGRFPDGWPNIFIRDKKQIRGANVVFLASFEKPSDVFEQIGAINSIPRFGSRSFTLILPDFPTGTMERLDADEEGEEVGKVVTAKTLARMLSDIPLSANGPAQIVIYDIHALQEKFYFGDNVIPWMRSAMPVFRSRISEFYDDLQDIAIVLPDEGAEKRFREMYKQFYTILCSKQRLGKKRKIRIESGNPSGKHSIIVDDRGLSGETAIATKDVLLDQGAKSVSLFVTHGVFPENSWEKFIGSGFNHVWMTDSCPGTVQLVSGIEPFGVISLKDTITEEILKGFDGQ